MNWGNEIATERKAEMKIQAKERARQRRKGEGKKQIDLCSDICRLQGSDLADGWDDGGCCCSDDLTSRLSGLMEGNEDNGLEG